MRGSATPGACQQRGQVSFQVGAGGNRDLTSFELERCRREELEDTEAEAEGHLSQCAIDSRLPAALQTVSFPSQRARELERTDRRTTRRSIIYPIANAVNCAAHPAHPSRTGRRDTGTRDARLIFFRSPKDPQPDPDIGIAGAIGLSGDPHAGLQAPSSGHALQVTGLRCSQHCRQ
jgi:hypothetical protein